MSRERKTPFWVWLLISTLAATQPALLLWVRYAPPEGAVPTGLQIPDSALFLQSMRMAEKGLETPYATSDLTDTGRRGVRFYAVPHLWLYGVLGMLARWLHLADYTLYGLANGVGVFFYLLAVFRLLQALVPASCGRAFLLFTLSGGPAGILYLLTGAAGWHNHPLFETYFTRFALYELMEGPHLNPVLYYPRLYYTVSLALCLGAFGGLVRACRENRAGALYPWVFPLLLGTFINARFGMFSLLLMVLYLVLASHLALNTRARLSPWFAVPIILGSLASYAVMRLNPTVRQNHLEVANMAMWFSPFVCAAWLHLLVAAKQAVRGVAGLPRWAWIAGIATLGYLAAYAALYVFYQGYYGNLLTGRDGSVAAAVSDWALLGALAGIGFALRFPARREPRGEAAFFALWFLLFAAVALSGFGQGWFLQFGPQRLQVFLWLPLCVLVAAGINGMPRKRAGVALAVLLACGAASVAVALLYFQGPLGRAAARGPYPTLHAEVMSEADARLMARAWQDGRVLTTAPAADVFALGRGNPVVFGVGSFNLTDLPYTMLREQVRCFFDPATSEAERACMVDEWQALYIYCPDTWPVDVRTVAALRDTDWIEEVAAEGRGALFRVKAGKTDNGETGRAAILPNGTP